jgi:uncharacterized protein YjbJ (UPF0337 family)
VRHRTDLVSSCAHSPQTERWEHECGAPGYVEPHYQENVMNKDQVKGRIEEVKGKAKEVTGKIVDDKTMEVEGKAQKNVGKLQSGFGDLKHDLKKGS